MSSSFDLRSLRSGAKTLYLVLGDQLDSESPILARVYKSDDAVLMMEVARESEKPISHVQRTVMFLSAMRHHAIWLKGEGLRVEYVRLDDDDNTQSFEDELKRAIKRFKAESVVIVQPGDHRVQNEIESACDSAGVELEILEDTHFMTTQEQFGEWASGRKNLVMEYFYREQRKRLDVLMTKDGKPKGGEWNYDHDNREAFKGPPRPSEPPSFKMDAITREVADLVGKKLPDLPGTMDAFNWPVTREQALECLDAFIDDRLRRFGPYEDAMWTGERTLYHSRLSPAINLHLLSPMECVERALEAYDKGEAPINSVEGFIRQLIGWREFIRGVYFLEGDGYTDRNELKVKGELPAFYWDADTDMACMADCVGSVVEEAYAHHIPRLMVMGNFAMLAGVTPREVSDWYLGMYADGVDWATAPNVVGMAMHADGGVVGTKPYAASGKYIKRMSNYCENCDYKVSKRTGEDACPFNTLYWNFLIEYEDEFKNNNRMAMIMKNVERLKKDERIEITVSAKKLRKKFGVMPS